MRCSIILLTIILVSSFSFVSASCDEGQIDINSASFEELQEFTGIGPAKSEEIINYREETIFQSVEELIEVNGIGPVTLENMKNEGACVADSNNPDDEENEEKSDEDSEDDETEENNDEEESNEGIENYEILSKNDEEEKRKSIVQEAIKLGSGDENTNPKSIKSKLNEKQKHGMYGLIAFCVLLSSLFIAKKFRTKKTEFEE